MADPKGDPSVPEAVRQAPTDEDLANELGRGDLGAFDQLVERHQRRIRTLCFRMSGNLSEVDDLTQETFLRVYRHREAYQPGKLFWTWLSRICVNVCLTHRHRQRKQGAPVALERFEESAARTGAPRDPERIASESEDAHSVKRVLDALLEPFRTTLILRVFGGLSYQEIAAEMACSLGTVMSRLNRARHQVKTSLKGMSC